MITYMKVKQTSYIFPPFRLLFSFDQASSQEDEAELTWIERRCDCLINVIVH